jgi:urease accessory protein
VPLADVGRCGRLELTFAGQRGRTVLRDTYCEVPFKITRILNPHESPAHLILMQCTSGLFGGDDVECSIRVERGAQVRITQQSATKIHPSQDRPAIQRNHVFVEEGAELQLYLEPIIPFADSVLRQTTLIDVEPGARLVFWEGFMAGRVGRGESWRFRELASETHLRSNGRSVFLDRFRLQQNGLERSTWAMGERTYFGAGLYVGPQAGCFAAKLHQALPEAGIDTLSADVAVTRIVSANGLDFHRSCKIFEGLAGV